MCSGMEHRLFEDDLSGMNVILAAQISKHIAHRGRVFMCAMQMLSVYGQTLSLSLGMAIAPQ